uniref:Uncharacterized protein n=1 Tax=Tanacetum cinerariifolium TaxID=118510 RepID=A0A6L2NCV3_TANCI|nr:hypothetical protein [Tanacetum cinerariifolium]
MRTKPGLDTLSFDDLYNNLRVFERDVKDYRAKRNQDSERRDGGYNGNKARDNGKRHAYKDDSKALVTIDEEDIDWSGHVEEDTQNYVMMAYSSNNLGSDNEVKSCSKTYEESYARLKKLYDEQRDKLGDDSVEITAYTLALKRLLNTQMSANDKFGLGYGDYRYGSILSYENEVLQSMFMNKECDLEDTPINDRYAEGMHAVLPPMIGNYMPSGPDVEIDYSKFTYGPKQTSADESGTKPVEYAYSESDSSINAPIIKEYELDSDDDSVSNVHENIKKPSFAFTDSVKLVKSPMENIKETGTPNHIPKIEKHDRYGHTRKGLGYTRKACFVCGSFSHLIRDCDFHKKRMAKQAALTKSKDKYDPHNALKDKGIVDSGFSKHMIGNKAHLADYQEFKGGFVAFGGSNERITGKGKIKSGRVLVTKPQNKTPYELLTGRQPIISYLRPFGRHVTILNTIDQLGKFDGKYDSGFLVGYSLNSKAFRVYNLETKRVEENLHVNLIENKPNVARKGHAWMFDLDYLTNSMNYEPVLVENQANKSAGPKEANNSTGTEANNDQGANSEEIDLYDEHFVLPIWTAYSTTIKSSRDKISKTSNCKTCEKPVSQVEQIFQEELKKLKRQEKEANDTIRKETTHETQNANTNSTNLLNDVSTPISIVSPLIALNDGEPSYPNDPSMPHLEDIYARPSEEISTDSSYDDEGVKAIGTKWVYRNKKDERGVVVGNKARLVTQRHRKEEGIDYDGVFAHVARIEAIRIFLAFASYMGFIVYQMDVKSAFMYGTIDEEVYVTQPPSFVDPKFPNKVYKIVKALYGLHQAPRAWYVTLSIFLEKSGYRRGAIDKTLFIKQDKNDIMLVQVYVDDIIFGSTKKSWCDEFEELMKNSQDTYVAEILKKFDFLSVKTASTPIETQKPLVKDEEAADVDVHLYRSMIGSLMYLTASRPDIMFAFCACSRFQFTPKTSHLQAVKRIFRYLKDQPKLGLWYPKVSSFDQEAYSDSNYAGANLDRKSTTRVLWIQDQLLDYGFNLMNTKIYIDKESTICIVKNPVFHSKTKHIEIQHHFIRDAYEKKLIQVLKIHIDDNVADLLTKAFDVSSKESASPKQTALGKDESNPLIVDSLLKTIWLSIHHVIAMKHWLFQSKRLLFWATASIKKVKDVVKLQALIDRKKVVVTKDIIRQDFRLDEFDVLITNQVDDLSSHITKYTSPALTQKAFANMRRIGKGFSGIETLLFATMLVQPQAAVEEEDEEDEVLVAPTPTSPTHEPTPPSQEPITSPPQAQSVTPPPSPPQAQPAPPSSPPQTQPTTTSTSYMTLLNTLLKTCTTLSHKRLRKVGGRIEKIDDDEEITLVDMEIQDDLGAELQGRLEEKYEVNVAAKEVNDAEPTVFNDEEVRPIFEREYNKVQTFLKPNRDEGPTKKRGAEETLLQESFKKLRAKIEVSGSHSTQDTPTDDPKEMSKEDVKNMLQIVPVSEFKVEALQVKEDLDALWRLTKEKFSTAMPTEDKEKALWVELKRLHDIFMFLEKDYPLTDAVLLLMLSTKLQVDEDCEMTRDLVMKIFMEANKPKSRRSLDTSSK